MSRFKTAALWGGIGLVVGASPFIYMNYPSATNLVEQKECSKQYNLINQLLDCLDYEDTSARLTNLSEELDRLRNRYLQEGKAKRVGIFVRDLVTSQWAATSEYERFIPASLLKVPLMVAYYRLAELDPLVLEQKLIYALPEGVPEPAKQKIPTVLLVPGASYTVDTLITQMVAQSDNVAMHVLSAHIDPGLLNDTMINLGIRIPSAAEGEMINFVTPKTYAGIFRILYNATYLNRDYSQKALEVLSGSSFIGMRKNMPQSVTVAHKFGEREGKDAAGVPTLQLHDCGIVYPSGKPYSICIMTQGDDFDELLSIIEELGSAVYKNI